MKNILAFEADQALAEDLRARFSQFGCSVDVVDDGNIGLQRARTHRPDLILLTIELPKMNGFSICNKLKKNPELKAIPLIILSSEATDDTFAQHRKLRTHAEDYLRKPFSFDTLLEKVTALLDLGPSLEMPQPPPRPADSEISVDTSGLDVVVEDEVGDSDLDDDVEAFTESAFAALQMDDLGMDDRQGDPGFETDDQTVAISRPLDFFGTLESSTDSASREARQTTPPPQPEDEDDFSELPEDYASPPPPPPPDSSPALPTPPSTPEFATPPARPIERPASSPATPEPPLAFEDETPAPVPSPDFDEAAREEAAQLREEKEALERAQSKLRADLTAAEKRLQQSQESWESERRKLKRDRDDLGDKVSLLEERLKTLEQGGASSGAVSSREFLDLRELLNKKDRELLDYKDQINAKEKAALDQRERITSLEREIAEGTERLLNVERDREGYREKLRAANDDKELLTKKVAGLEKRLETAAAENERLKGELVEERKRREAELAAAEARRSKDLSELEARLSAESDADKERALEDLRQELEEARQAAIEQLEDRHAQSLEEAEERRTSELTEQRLRHESQLAAREQQLTSEQEQRLAELKAQHQRELDEAAKHSATELASKLGEKDQQLQTLEQQAAQAAELSTAELERLEARVAELEVTLDQRQVEAEELSATLADQGSALGQRDQRIGELEQASTQQAQLLSQREQELQELRGQLESMTGWNAHNERRAQRALEKLQADGEVLEQTKRAMAIALTLLADLSPLEEDASAPVRP